MRKKYMPPELRFPNRLERVRRVGVAIAQSRGRRIKVGRGRPLTANFRGFDILFFTPFTQPTTWTNIDWDDPKVRRSLYGLSISYEGYSRLSILWVENKPKNVYYVRWFLDPSRDSWDRRLRRSWNDFERKTQIPGRIKGHRVRY
jgi:hypothetical protein